MSSSLQGLTTNAPLYNGLGRTTENTFDSLTYCIEKHAYVGVSYVYPFPIDQVLQAICIISSHGSCLNSETLFQSQSDLRDRPLLLAMVDALINFHCHPTCVLNVCKMIGIYAID